MHYFTPFWYMTHLIANETLLPDSASFFTRSSSIILGFTHLFNPSHIHLLLLSGMKDGHSCCVCKIIVGTEQRDTLGNLVRKISVSVKVYISKGSRVFRCCPKIHLSCAVSMHHWHVIFFFQYLILSCNNWDKASHRCGDFLLDHGLLCHLPEMIVTLDWTDWVAAGWERTHLCGPVSILAMGVASKWQTKPLLGFWTLVNIKPVLPPSGD